MTPTCSRVINASGPRCSAYFLQRRTLPLQHAAASAGSGLAAAGTGITAIGCITVYYQWVASHFSTSLGVVAEIPASLATLGYNTGQLSHLQFGPKSGLVLDVRYSTMGAE